MTTTDQQGPDNPQPDNQQPDNPLPGIAIRSARVTDAPEIARLASQLGYPNEAGPIVARLQTLAGRSGHWVGVATAARAEEAGLAGWVHVAHCIALESGEYAEILGLVVDAHARRRGIGQGLVAAAERWSREAALARLIVRSNSARVEAHPFYAALGYARPKSQHVYIKRFGCFAHE